MNDHKTHRSKIPGYRTRYIITYYICKDPNESGRTVEKERTWIGFKEWARYNKQK